MTTKRTRLARLEALHGSPTAARNAILFISHRNDEAERERQKAALMEDHGLTERDKAEVILCNDDLTEPFGYVGDFSEVLAQVVETGGLWRPQK